MILTSAKSTIEDQFFFPNKRRDINNKFWTVNGNTGRYLFYFDVPTYTKTVLFTWVEVDGVGGTVTVGGSFSFKDVDSNGNTFTSTANFSFQRRSWDIDAGSISVHIDDGMVGLTYSTGLIDFQNDYRSN